jgi:hypothetical protein
LPPFTDRNRGDQDGLVKWLRDLILGYLADGL